MAPQLNHTLVQVHDAEATASFLTEVLGLPPAYRYGPFLCVETSNAVSLDVIEFEPDVAIDTQHYAFLVTDQEFDEIFARITERNVAYYADPGLLASRRGQRPRRRPRHLLPRTRRPPAGDHHRPLRRLAHPLTGLMRWPSCECWPVR